MQNSHGCCHANRVAEVAAESKLKNIETLIITHRGLIELRIESWTSVILDLKSGSLCAISYPTGILKRVFV